MAATRIYARELRIGDTIVLGGKRDRVTAIRRDGALVVALLEPLGAWLTFSPNWPVTLVSRKPLETVTGTPEINGEISRADSLAVAPSRSSGGDYLGKGDTGIAPYIASAVTAIAPCCGACGAPLPPGRAGRRYCGDACRQRARRERRAQGERKAA
jgi:hypothetical protein